MKPPWLALLSDFLAAEEFAADRLTRVLVDLELGAAKLVALYPIRRMLQPRVRQFLEFMERGLGPTTSAL